MTILDWEQVKWAWAQAIFFEIWELDTFYYNNQFWLHGFTQNSEN